MEENGGLGVERLDFLGQLQNLVRLLLKFGARGKASECGFVARVDQFRDGEQAHGVGEVAGGDVYVRLQPQRLGVFRVHLQRLLGEVLGVLQVEGVEGHEPFTDEGFNGLRVDLQGLVEGVECVGSVVFVEEHSAGEVLGLPPIGVVLQGVAVDFVQDEAELLRTVVPERVLGSGLPDDEQQLGIDDRLVRVLGVRILANEPAHFFVGRGDIALVADDASPHPPREEVLLVLRDHRLGILQRVVPLAECEEQIGPMSTEVRILRGSFDRVVERGESFGVLAFDSPALGDADGGFRGVLLVLGEFLEPGPRLGHVPALQPLPRLGNRIGGFLFGLECDRGNW